MPRSPESPPATMPSTTRDAAAIPPCSRPVTGRRPLNGSSRAVRSRNPPKKRRRVAAGTRRLYREASTVAGTAPQASRIAAPQSTAAPLP
jgi:hypothetical protein